MTYIEGFVMAVPAANKDKFVAHATLSDAVFVDHGATRVVECWQDYVSKGQHTDFFSAVDAQVGESVVFSWIEWPNKAARDAMAGQMEKLMKTDDRLRPEKNPMPFDGRRMIYGGFAAIVELGEHVDGSYVQGFLIPVPEGKRELYRTMAKEIWPMFHDYGALRVVETWQDDVPEGKQTDFLRAVKAKPDEKIVFSFIEWPSRTICEAAHEKMQSDERMQMQPDTAIPFDGKRMIYGSFAPVVDLSRPLVLGERP
jgi:uncharacterized protein YbaA (DUF1428 family)